MKKLFLIDGMALIYRSFYAFINNPLTTKEGFPTSAIFGFLNSISKIIKEESPDYISIAMDSQKPTFRHDLYESYKANRKKMPDDLRLQIPEINKIIEKCKMNLLIKEGYEADDIIATITKSISREDLKIYIVTGDKDIMQLVDDNTFVYNPGNKFSGPIVYDSNKVKEKWGVPPSKICDLLSIMGDGSDNIPGAKGIGPKTACKLIKQFNSVENILSSSNEISNIRIKGLIEDQIEDIRLSNKLVQLDMNVPIKVDIDSMLINNIDFSEISSDLIGFEMPTLLDSLKIDTGDQILDSSIQSFDTVTSKYHLITTKTQLDELKNDISKQSIVSFDLETSSIDPLKADIVGISFSFSANEGYYIPLLFPNEIDSYDLSTEYVLKELKESFENSNIGFIGQNIKFDAMILKRFGLNVSNIAFDTMIASHLINPMKNSYRLDDLALEYLDYKKINIESLIGYKGNQIGMSEVSLDKIKNYACEDADVVFQLFKLLHDKLEAMSLLDLFNNVEMLFVKVLIEIESNGVYVDIQMLDSLSENISMQINDILTSIYECADKEFNVNSPKQLAEVLFDDLKLKPIRKRSTAVEVLEILKKYHPLPEIILRYRHLNKLKTTYLDGIPKFLNKETGRIHTSFNQTVASTGRLSSTKPNFQNIPIRTDSGKEIRKAFKPQNKDWKLISADYSQIELRIMAHFSKEPALVEAFLRDEDVHSRTASLVYNIPLDSVTSDQRRQAKIVNYGIMYGAGPFRMSQELNINMADAKQIIDNYFKTYKSIRNYIDQNIEDAKKKGYVKTYFGRKRDTINLNSSNANIVNAEKRAAINMPIQGTASELIKVAMLNIHNFIKENNLKSKMILQVHDELLFEVPQDEEKIMFDAIIDKMENSIKLDIPLKVDCKIGDNWYDIH